MNKVAETTDTHTHTPTSRSVFSASPEDNSKPNIQLPQQPKTVRIITTNLDNKGKADNN